MALKQNHPFGVKKFEKLGYKINIQVLVKQKGRVGLKLTRLPVLHTLISMMLNPTTILKSTLSEIPWFFSLLVSTFAFALFFLQTGLDLYRTGQRQLIFVLKSMAIGAVYGTIAIPFLAVVVWGFFKITRNEKSLFWTISSFCLSYSGALIYGLFGLFFSLVFNWKTAIAFGVTGVLWATGPLITTIREMTRGNTSMGVLFASAIGIVVLVTWSIFANI